MIQSASLDPALSVELSIGSLWDTGTASRDYWMSAIEAKEFGMIDEVLTRGE